MPPPTDPPPDPRLEDLLERWDALRGQGLNPSPADLTRDPALLPALQRLVADILAAEEALGGGPPPPTKGVPGRYESPAYHREGGMGIVYRARDQELGREVAYKVIKPHLGSDLRAVEKFLNEARVTARLQHPGVLPIYGLSADASGRPAYAMRFVEGADLLAAVEQFHRTHPRVPASRAGWQGLLNHFVRVCQTVGYAHSQGVVHRDLSPGNVLLVGDGETLVIDWGLALDATQARDNARGADSELTAATRAGTVPFTAPEVWDEHQHQPFGPPSDIYSLGALLYLILGGRPPYSGGTTPEVVAKVRAGPPPEVQTVRPGVPRPLARICARAMSRDPAQRYATADELAHDVGLWLAGERVGADKEPWQEAAWRWASRHRTVAGMATVLLLAVAVGGPVAYVRERNLRERAEVASGRADSERQAAEAERRRADLAAEEILAQAETVGSLQATLPAAKAVLDRGARYLEDLARDSEDDPARRALVADYYLRAGRIRFKLNQLPEAAESFARAMALAERLFRENPTDAANRHRWAMCLREWGVAQAVRGRTDQAGPAWAKALELLQPLRTAGRPYRHTLAKLYMALGNLHMFGGKGKEAHEAFARGRAIASGLVAEAPEEASYRFTLADIRNNQGMLLLGEAMPPGQAVTDPGKLRKSQAAHREALALRRQLVRAEPGNPDYKAYLAASYNHLGNTLQAQGEKGFAEAEANYREALALLEPLAVAFPAVPSHRREVAQIFNNLNQLLARQKRWAEAEALGRRAVGHFTRLAKQYPALPELSSDLGVALEQLANTLRLRGRAEAAREQEFAAAVEFARASASSGDPAQREARASKAVALLQRVRREGYFADARRVELLRSEPAFRTLRGRPDYIKLLAGLGRK